jgi:hypothetical protein
MFASIKKLLSNNIFTTNSFSTKNTNNFYKNHKILQQTNHVCASIKIVKQQFSSAHLSATKNHQLFQHNYPWLQHKKTMCLQHFIKFIDKIQENT